MGSGPTVESQPSPGELATRWWNRRRGIAVVLAMVLVAVLLGLIASRQSRGDLHPDGVDPGGARAVVTLLDEQGVDVTPARTTDDAVAATEPGDTLVVTVPDLLSDQQADRLLGTGADLVLVAPDATAATFRPGLETTPGGFDEVLDPRCDDPAAEQAGAARVGGLGYEGRDEATACYPGPDGATLVLDTLDDGASLVVLGTGSPLTNEHLDQDGNAALALNLLGRNDHLTWYRPVPEASAAVTSPVALLPSWVAPVVWQLGIAAVLAAVWRGRRLGRLVPETLPVVVRAAETTEGRARLYRRGRSRAHAAAIVRDASKRRLRVSLGLPVGTTDAALAEAVAYRTGRPGVEVAAALAGPEPTADTGLVGLADTLDTLEKEVRTP